MLGAAECTETFAFCASGGGVDGAMDGVGRGNYGFLESKTHTKRKRGGEGELVVHTLLPKLFNVTFCVCICGQSVVTHTQTESFGF